MKLQTRGLLRATIVVAALILGVSATAGPSQPAHGPDRWVAVGSTNNNANQNCNGVNNSTCPGSGPVKAFGVDLGEIPLMYPGSSAPLSVRFTNPEAFPIRVQSIEISKSLATQSEDCPIGELAVSPDRRHTYSTPVVVPAKGSAVAPPIQIGLASSADSTCEGATFTIRAVASAVK